MKIVIFTRKLREKKYKILFLKRTSRMKYELPIISLLLEHCQAGGGEWINISQIHLQQDQLCNSILALPTLTTFQGGHHLYHKPYMPIPGLFLGCWNFLYIERHINIKHQSNFWFSSFPWPLINRLKPGIRFLGPKIGNCNRLF